MSLNSKFAETDGEPIEVDGRLVHIGYERPISPGTHFLVKFVSHSSPLQQGVTLRVLSPQKAERRRAGTRYAGELEVNGIRSSSVSLWQESAPPEVTVTCIKATPAALLSVANQWRRPDGVEDQFTNNAGIVIEENPNGVTLWCSNGIGQPAFDDLVVRLEFSE